MKLYGVNFKSLSKYIIYFLCAVFIAIGHKTYLETLFENDRHFSHLSALEREMTFRTEMGLYYSYFKTVVEAPSLAAALRELTRNNLTEFPSTINTLQRFTLYPELQLGLLYRALRDNNWLEQTCWMVERGDDEESDMVESCEGMGVPAIFYTSSVFFLNGLVPTALFLYGIHLSGTFLGGAVALAAFLFNHGEATRVQWTPPLRESWAYPALLAQMLLVSLSLRSRGQEGALSLVIGIFTVTSLISWQFSQFPLATQTVSLATLWSLGLVPATTLKKLLLTLLTGLGFAYVILFGNSMLLGSFFFATLLATLLVLTLDQRYLSKKKFGPYSTLMIRGFSLTVGTLLIRGAASRLLNLKDDSHIWNLLLAKFSSFRDFHTLLYICAAEFDFLPLQTVVLLCKTLVLPTGLFFCTYTLYQVWLHWRRNAGAVDPQLSQQGFAALQTLAFLLMAVLIMRLKMFLVPHLCLLSSLAASAHGRFSAAAAVGLVAIMAVQGVTNLREQTSIIGEYSNPPQEALLSWIKANTPQDAAFAGSMPTMASVLLSTRRPVVIHPHYEHHNLRERTKEVYALYSRKPISHVYKTLRRLSVDYVILDKSMCISSRKPGCGMVEIWDTEDPQHRHRTPLCAQLLSDKPPFTKLVPKYSNDLYLILHFDRGNKS